METARARPAKTVSKLVPEATVASPDAARAVWMVEVKTGRIVNRAAAPLAEERQLTS